jgi:hypothetical protein
MGPLIRSLFVEPYAPEAPVALALISIVQDAFDFDDDLLELDRLAQDGT